MPTHPTGHFAQEEFAGVQLIDNLPWSDGYPLMKIKATDNARRPTMQGGALADARTVLHDLHTDPQQKSPLKDPQIIKK